MWKWVKKLENIITDVWNEYLEFFDTQKKDIYYLEEYVKLYEAEDSKAVCAICKEENRVLLMPFIRKEICGYFDFETAYGYGGPIANTNDEMWINSALDEMEMLLRKERYICGFVRFNTLLGNAEICKNHFQVLLDRKTVSINTLESPNQIWAKQIISKNRNMIRKAEKNGLVYKAEYNFESLPEFINLYNNTMKRLNAESFYFFDKKYYNSFVNSFKGNAFLGTIRKEDKLICAALFMYSENYGHYHLEGSDYNYSNLAANNLLLWKTALEFNKLGVKEFHLGGGYNGDPDNSLLKFKKSFSHNLKDFYIGKWIFNNEKYLEIKKKWEKENPYKIDKYGKLLLCYRY